MVLYKKLYQLIDILTGFAWTFPDCCITQAQLEARLALFASC